MVYTTPIMMTKTNKFLGWPPLIPLKYPDYKKDADLDVHVKVFQATIKSNGKTIINAFSYTFRETTSNWCHNCMSKFLYCAFFELTQTSQIFY
jgi:hypothetical protein